MSKDNGPMQKLPEGPRSDRPGGPNLKLSRNLLSWMILMGTAMVLLVYLQSRYPSPEPITLSKFYTYVDDGQIERLIINHGEGKLEGWRKRTGADPAGTEPVRFVVNYPQGAMDSEFLRELRDKLPKADIKEEKPNPYLVMLLQFLPWLILFAFIWFFIFRQIRNVGTGGGMLGSFGRSRHRVSTKEHTNITFAARSRSRCSVASSSGTAKGARRAGDCEASARCRDGVGDGPGTVGAASPASAPARGVTTALHTSRAPRSNT